MSKFEKSGLISSKFSNSEVTKILLGDSAFKDILVKVIPNSRINEIVESSQNYLKIKIKARPINGQANKELIKFLAKELKVAPTQLEIIKGLTSKTKLVRMYIT